MGSYLMKLLLADDHGLFRDSMALWLRQLGDNIDIVAVDDLGSAQRALQKSDFDLIVLDLYMPQMQGALSIELLCRQYPKSALVIVSGEENQQIIDQCIAAGASGYVPKAASGEDILNALRQVLNGQPYYPQSKIPLENTSSSLIFNDKQRRILALIVEGKSNREIADTLFLSEGTIKQYVTKLLRLLGVDNRVQASAKAAEMLGIQRR
jgi:DNA-binding NarL/FixJ family response regulator